MVCTVPTSIRFIKVSPKQVLNTVKLFSLVSPRGGTLFLVASTFALDAPKPYKVTAFILSAKNLATVLCNAVFPGTKPKYR